MTPVSTPEALFGALLADAPSRPFVTFYDEATGERSELSTKSLANWVAKTHFLLTDELGLGLGDLAQVALPAHWISVPALLGALTAGLELGTSPLGAAVAFVEPATVAAADGVPDVYCIAPASAAFGLRDAVPDGAQDFVLAVRPQGDSWAAVRPPATAADRCWSAASRGEVVAAARDRAAELGLVAGARMLTDRTWTGPSDWLDTLIVPLVLGGSVVYVANAPSESVLERRADQERAVRLP
ncbi:TIGR03089 family protein [Jatrophihabitans sp.]|uniref:TIGR03089 family protein n=1 Tax=Jatrophihabitans sp. TaxID=1932789 RepID=UPI0030C7531F|nr:hypothetical protein [Jatrophihabitans sp.]